jgi:hypothetical protein
MDAGLAVSLAAFELDGEQPASIILIIVSDSSDEDAE